MSSEILNKLMIHLDPAARSVAVSDVRVGLGYTAVRIEGGATGLCWTPSGDPGSCTHMNQAGTLAGRSARELLQMLAEPSRVLLRAVGLATANALLTAMPRPVALQGDVLATLDIGAADRVAMVGYFAPLLPSLRESGCKLDIIERKPAKPGTVSPEIGRAALASCSVAIITATTLVNGTCDEVLSSLGEPRAVVLLGPSTPMSPQAFTATPVTHVAGAWVQKPDDVLRIVSEGGGTQLLKRYLEFATIPV
ncbi:MAG TPA: DUF364 domain-containing protein [Anaeromyxobacteraceae bacterium]|nr:DUF364 domain-containing protein [Anaeromyxobacteraceae bacterium]